MTLARRFFLSWCLLLCIGLSVGGALHAAPAVADAVTLHAQYVRLKEQLDHNEFNRPLIVRSDESAGNVHGEVFAVIDTPFTQASASLRDPVHWCDIMILHINTKFCSAKASKGSVELTVNVGKKTPQNLSDTQQLNFNYQVLDAGNDYFSVALDAAEGPMGTRDYSIVLDATRLSNEQTFLHLSYSYAVNFIGKIAMEAYLSTAGRHRVGFTVLKVTPTGQAVYIAGRRGLVERNAMRYFLAINAYLDSERAPPEAREENRLQNWISWTELYPKQLQEMSTTAYLDMKRSELRRQHAAP